jgi:flagellar motor switch protein FliM
MIFVARFTLDVENASGTMTICIPYATIEPIREKLSYRFHSLELEVDEAWRKYIQEKIKEMTVNLSCNLGTTHITGRELLEIKVDDVIPLDQKTNDPLLVNVEGVAKFFAHPGTYNDKKAIKVEGKVNEE